MKESPPLILCSQRANKASHNTSHFWRGCIGSFQHFFMCNDHRHIGDAEVGNYTIPVLTPFKLTGSATDPDGDAVTYNWEQNDSAENTGVTVVASSANPTKPIGPNFISFRTTSSPTK